MLISAILRKTGRHCPSVPETELPLPPYRDEKDSQGENMFLRCVSELVIESREVRLAALFSVLMIVGMHYCMLACLCAMWPGTGGAGEVLLAV